MGKRYLVVTILVTFSSSAFAQIYEIAAFSTDVATAAEAEQDPGPSNPTGPSSSPPVTGQNPLQDARDRVYYPGDTERAKPLARKLVGNIHPAALKIKVLWVFEVADEFTAELAKQGSPYADLIANGLAAARAAL